MRKIYEVIAVCILATVAIQSNAQGVIVYQHDGVKINIPYENLDSIVTYESVMPENPNLVGAVAEAIDLGLPSGTLWASWNVGATSASGFGGYYAWGETEEKDTYSDATYKYNSGLDIGNDISGTEYDIAHVMWGDGWRMPTDVEFQELIDKCTWVWTTFNGNTHGFLITGVNGNRIFLPAMGYRSGTSLLKLDTAGSYWSSIVDESYNGYAKHLYFESGGSYVSNLTRFVGRLIRPVKKISGL